MDLAVNKMVLLVIFLVVLVAAIYLIITGQNVLGQTNLENEIRQCCQTYRANDCKFGDYICPNGDYIWMLAQKAGYNEGMLNRTCGC